MADCADITDLALVLGLLRSARVRKRASQTTQPDMNEDIQLYTEMAQRYYKAITKDCGTPQTPQGLEGKNLWDEDVNMDFGDATGPMLGKLVRQCGCQCKAGEPLSILEGDYADAITTYATIHELEEEFKGKLGEK